MVRCSGCDVGFNAHTWAANDPHWDNIWQIRRPAIDS